MAVTARKPILETVYQAEPADEEQEEQSGFYQEPAQQEQAQRKLTRDRKG